MCILVRSRATGRLVLIEEERMGREERREGKREEGREEPA